MREKAIRRPTRETAPAAPAPPTQKASVDVPVVCVVPTSTAIVRAALHEQSDPPRYAQAVHCANCQKTASGQVLRGVSLNDALPHLRQVECLNCGCRTYYWYSGVGIASLPSADPDPPQPAPAGGPRYRPTPPLPAQPLETLPNNVVTDRVWRTHNIDAPTLTFRNSWGSWGGDIRTPPAARSIRPAGTPEASDQTTPNPQVPPNQAVQLGRSEPGRPVFGHVVYLLPE